jgi:vancomycin permeability regulator SanA
VFFTIDLLWILIWFPKECEGRIFQRDALPAVQGPALVLGAGVHSDGEPSPVLEGRLETALDLYRSGKVTWILVSGDNRAQNYNEPQAMRKWLIKRGIPVQRVVSDYAGRRTYDSLKRAQRVFGVKRAVVVTSDFHLPRALFLAKGMGLDALGVGGDTRSMPFRSRAAFEIREFAARHMAVWDRWFPPDTMLGPREPTPDDWGPRP